MTSMKQAVQRDEIARLRARMGELETLLADHLIARAAAERRALEVEQWCASLTQQLDAAQCAQRYAIGEALDDAWPIDHARLTARDASEELIRRCREIATTREMAHFVHDLGGEPYEHAADALCWLLDRHEQLGVPVVHRGRELPGPCCFAI